MHRETSGSILEESAYAQRIGFMSVSSHDIHIVTPRCGELVSAVRPCTDPSRNQYKAGRSAKRRPHILDDVSYNANSIAEDAAPTRPRKAVCQKSELVPAERMGLALDTFADPISQ